MMSFYNGRCLALFCVTAFLVACISCRDWCPEHCSCRKSSITCMCTSDDDVIIPRHVLERGIRMLHVRGCKQASVISSEEPIPTTDLELKFVSFENLLELKIEPFAIANLGRVRSIIIDNVQRWNVSADAFFNAEVIDILELKNVKIDKLETDSFSYDFPIENFHVFDSEIDMIMSSGLSIESGKNLVIKNTTFKAVQEYGISISQYTNATMYSNHFETLNSGSFYIDDVKSIDIKTSKFDQMPSKIFAARSNCRKFSFVSNTVDIVRKEVFVNLQVLREFRFLENLIKQHEPEALNVIDVFNSSGTDFRLRNNAFYCDCQINWILKNPTYRRLFRTSKCFGPEQLAGKEFSALYRSTSEFPC